MNYETQKNVINTCNHINQNPLYNVRITTVSPYQGNIKFIMKIINYIKDKKWKQKSALS